MFKQIEEAEQINKEIYCKDDPEISRCRGRFAESRF